MKKTERNIKKSRVDYADDLTLSYKEYRDFKELEYENKERCYELFNKKLNKNDSIQTY